jgi:hypothetical protein
VHACRIRLQAAAIRRERAHRHARKMPLLPQMTATHLPQRATLPAFHRREVATARTNAPDPNRFFRIAVA